MYLFEHLNSGAKGLRVASYVCAWLAIIVVIGGVLWGATERDVNILISTVIGIFAGGFFCFVGLCARALATIAEAAELYYWQNSSSLDQEE